MDENPENTSEQQETEVADVDGQATVDEQAAVDEQATGTVGPEAKSPQYSQLVDGVVKNSDASLGRFYDVEVTISAEIGRVSMPIGEIVKLGEGSVIDLDRPITSPVEVVAQGVRIATGEVVVIDDCFAVRIKEIDSNIPDQ